MKCLADYDVDSDLCLPESRGPLKIHGANGEFELSLSNAHPDHALPAAALAARLVFETENFDNIRDIAGQKLAAALSCLAYATNRKFVLRRLKRVIDWTPGIVERDAIVYAEAPVNGDPEPLLDEAFALTAERFLSMQSGDEQKAAMRWYKLGIQAEVLEEQFQYFWFALEIAAQSLKGTDKVHSLCPHCHSSLFCESCQKHPVHKRYPGEAIKQMIERVHPKDSDEVFEALQLVRHSLMHGSILDSVQAQLPCTGEQAVETLAYVSWQAIGLMFSESDPHPNETMALGQSEQLIRKTMVASARVRTTLLRGDPNDPRIEDFPTIEVSLTKSPYNAASKD